MAVDLPALDRPTKAISGSSVTGSSDSLLAVVRKRAVCVQARASFAFAALSVAAPAWGKGGGMGSLMCGAKRSL
jgi:hypothetical protein